MNMNKKSMEDVKRLASDITKALGGYTTLAGLTVLLKLLYKQKIKPMTALLLMATYSLNNREVNKEIYSTLKDSFKRILEIKEEPIKEEKCMGFDIK